MNKCTKDNFEVEFFEDTHTYIGKKDKANYISVTTLISKFHEKFDKEFWLSYKTLEQILDKDYFAKIKPILTKDKKIKDEFLKGIDFDTFVSIRKSIEDEWSSNNKEACEYGTRIHNELENMFYKTPKELIKKVGLFDVERLNIKNSNDFLNTESGIFPELLISYHSPDEKLKIAGQSDLVIKNGNKIKIWDWKTNKNISTKAYYDSTLRKQKTMIYPINNLPDHTLMHYQIQLSLYAFMLRKWNPEFEIEELKIVHFQHDGKQKEYVLDYLEKDVERMLAYYKGKMLKEEMYEKLKPIEY